MAVLDTFDAATFGTTNTGEPWVRQYIYKSTTILSTFTLAAGACRGDHGRDTWDMATIDPATQTNVVEADMKVFINGIRSGIVCRFVDSANHWFLRRYMSAGDNYVNFGYVINNLETALNSSNQTVSNTTGTLQLAVNPTSVVAKWITAGATRTWSSTAVTHVAATKCGISHGGTTLNALLEYRHTASAAGVSTTRPPLRQRQNRVLSPRTRQRVR